MLLSTKSVKSRADRRAYRAAKAFCSKNVVYGARVGPLYSSVKDSWSRERATDQALRRGFGRSVGNAPISKYCCRANHGWSWGLRSRFCKQGRGGRDSRLFQKTDLKRGFTFPFSTMAVQGLRFGFLLSSAFLYFPLDWSANATSVRPAHSGTIAATASSMLLKDSCESSVTLMPISD